MNITVTRHFVLATHLTGLRVYTWLTTAEMYQSDDCWCSSRVTGCEDRDGEMIPHDVRLADLEDFEAV